MLVHFRLTVPDDLSDRVRDLLVEGECITNVTVESGICVDPEGDLIECDVAREKAGTVLHQLNELGLDDRGGIVITSPLSTPFAEASRLEALAPGHPDDAVIWESVEAKADDGAQPTVSYLVFLVLAVILAAIAVVTDSAILVVGAMVVGPEFSAVAAVSVGIVFARWGLVGRSLQLLVLSFAFAVAVVAVLAWLVGLTSALDGEMLTQPRPNTGFIWHPDMWSFIVALVAGRRASWRWRSRRPPPWSASSSASPPCRPPATSPSGSACGSPRRSSGRSSSSASTSPAWSWPASSSSR